jgi:hypothetical protein
MRVKIGTPSVQADSNPSEVKVDTRDHRCPRAKLRARSGYGVETRGL